VSNRNIYILSDLQVDRTHPRELSNPSIVSASVVNRCRRRLS